jgi:hypothetical protein
MVEDSRKPPAGARHRDAAAGGILGEPKRLGAIGEESPVSLGGVEDGARVEGGQMGEELDGRFTLLAGDQFESSEKIVIAE